MQNTNAFNQHTTANIILKRMSANHGMTNQNLIYFIYMEYKRISNQPNVQRVNTKCTCFDEA